MRELIFSYLSNLLRKIKEGIDRWIGKWDKMSQAINENELPDKIKRLLWEFSLYWKFMCTDKNNDNNKTNLPLSPFQSSYSFLD